MGEAIRRVFMEKSTNITSALNSDGIHPDTEKIIRHYQFEKLPVEGTLFKSTYCSSFTTEKGNPAGTAMIGLYSENPLSVS